MNDLYMKSLLNIFIAIALVLILGGCPDETLRPASNPIKLVIEDASCTEAFIKIILSGEEKNRSIILKREDSIIVSLNMVNNDTSIVDEGLLPQKGYTYKLTNGSWNISAQVTTMDTTSHNWSYDLVTLGENGSYLVDIAIISDTLAYAVGEIHIADTLYNVAKWDGKTWKLYSLQYNGFAAALKSVFAFNDHDIWMDPWFHWNGNEFAPMPIDPVLMGVGINNMWGNINGLYAVGSNGFICNRTKNGLWQKISSGTTQNLSGIKGNSSNLYAIGANRALATGIVLKENNDNWDKIIDGVTEVSGFNLSNLFKSQLYGSTEGIWIDPAGALYTVGNFMYRYKFNKWNYEKSLPENHLGGQIGYRGYLHDVDGNNSNDMIIVGQRGTIRHFNGNTWTQVGIPYNYSDELHYWYNVAMKGNLSIAVGSIDRRASIIVLFRK